MNNLVDKFFDQDEINKYLKKYRDDVEKLLKNKNINEIKIKKDYRCNFCMGIKDEGTLRVCNNCIISNKILHNNKYELKYNNDDMDNCLVETEGIYKKYYIHPYLNNLISNIIIKNILDTNNIKCIKIHNIFSCSNKLFLIKDKGENIEDFVNSYKGNKDHIFSKIIDKTLNLIDLMEEKLSLENIFKPEDFVIIGTHKKFYVSFDNFDFNIKYEDIFLLSSEKKYNEWYFANKLFSKFSISKFSTILSLLFYTRILKLDEKFFIEKLGKNFEKINSSFENFSLTQKYFLFFK